MMKPAGFFVASAMVCPLTAGLMSGLCVLPANAQSKSQAKAPGATASTPPNAGAWAVTCSNQTSGDLLCDMTQVLIDSKTRRQLVLISVKRAASDNSSNGSSTAALFRVFHGVYLPAGLTAQIDSGSPLQLPFQKSDQLGVYAAMPLNDKLVAEMRRGRNLKIRIELNKAKPLYFNAFLEGFGKAFDRVVSAR